MMLLAVLISSDFYAERFWFDHPLTTAIVGSLTVVLVSVTAIEAVLNRRSEHRWRLLAQYALMELAEAARTAWAVLLGIVDQEDGPDVQTFDPSLVRLSRPLWEMRWRSPA
jgi:multisubunit Na+/H+ antiporter MnhE subunit